MSYPSQFLSRFVLPKSQYHIAWIARLLSVLKLGNGLNLLRNGRIGEVRVGIRVGFSATDCRVSLRAAHYCLRLHYAYPSRDAHGGVDLERKLGVLHIARSNTDAFFPVHIGYFDLISYFASAPIPSYNTCTSCVRRSIVNEIMVSFYSL